jgi:uncharacterized delta-60 repeat protein
VYSATELSDGKYLIGGDFTKVNDDTETKYVARLNNDSTRDTTFTPITLTLPAGVPDGTVRSIAELSDGKYFIGGNFTNAGGDANTDYIARLNNDGTRDTAFTPLTLDSSVNSAIELSDGKYLIGGNFTNAGGDANTDYIARLNGDGTRDTAFTPLTLNGAVRSITELSDGNYLIGGNFTNAGGDANTDYIARLNNDGTRDTAFTPSTLSSYVLSVAELSDGKYLIGGIFSNAGGDADTDYIARLNSDGTRDTTFTPLTLDNSVISAIELSDGKYLIGGGFTNAGGDADIDYIARLNSDGTRDTDFTPPGPLFNLVRVVVALSDGNYLMGGSFPFVGSNPAPNYIARLLSELPANTTTVPVPGPATYFTFLLPDGRECSAISPQQVQVGTMVELPDVDALCQTMPGSSVAGWAIPSSHRETGYGTVYQPFPPGLKVRVTDSQRFTLVPFEPIMRIDYDANIAESDTCTPANLAHTSDDGRIAHSWVPREIFTMARTPAQAPCAPEGYELIGWNTRGDGSGETLEPGAGLPDAWHEGGTNHHTLYAMWSRV